jgi:hypothetical protein
MASLKHDSQLPETRNPALLNSAMQMSATSADPLGAALPHLPLRGATAPGPEATTAFAAAQRGDSRQSGTEEPLTRELQAQWAPPIPPGGLTAPKTPFPPNTGPPLPPPAEARNPFAGGSIPSFCIPTPGFELEVLKTRLNTVEKDNAAARAERDTSRKEVSSMRAELDDLKQQIQLLVKAGAILPESVADGAAEAEATAAGSKRDRETSETNRTKPEEAAENQLEIPKKGKTETQLIEPLSRGEIDLFTEGQNQLKTKVSDFTRKSVILNRTNFGKGGHFGPLKELVLDLCLDRFYPVGRPGMVIEGSFLDFCGVQFADLKMSASNNQALYWRLLLLALQQHGGVDSAKMTKSKRRCPVHSSPANKPDHKYATLVLKPTWETLALEESNER